MASRVRLKSHARFRAGEKLEITLKGLPIAIGCYHF